MQIPLRVHVTGPEPAGCRDLIAAEAAKLETFSDRITGCDVDLRVPETRHRSGDRFAVRVHLTVPGHHEIVVDADPGDEPEHLHLAVAVRDAFRKARRQLQDVVRRMDGDVKAHEPPRTGRIARFLAGTEGGFIETDDGDEVYFHRNSVIGGIDHLKVGDRVRFAEEIGEKGLQASTIHPA